MKVLTIPDLKSPVSTFLKFSISDLRRVLWYTFSRVGYLAEPWVLPHNQRHKYSCYKIQGDFTK